MELKIHSFVSWISNSSTEVYVSPYTDSLDTIRNIINNVLEAAGSDKKADDLYDIYFKMDNPGDATEKFLEEQGENLSWSELKEHPKYKEYCNMKIYSTEDARNIVKYTGWDNEWDEQVSTGLSLYIEPKNENGVKLSGLFSDIFGYEVVVDG